MDYSSLFSGPTATPQSGSGGLLDMLGGKSADPTGAAAMQMLGAGAPRALPTAAPQMPTYGYGGARQPSALSSNAIALLRQRLGMPALQMPAGLGSPFGSGMPPQGAQAAQPGAAGGGLSPALLMGLASMMGNR